MARAKVKTDVEGRFVGLNIRCPGCSQTHTVPLRALPPAFSEVGESPHVGSAHRWEFTGDLERPTFVPSLHIKTGHHCDGQPPADQCQWCKMAEEDGEPTLCKVCHSFVRDGRIEFLSDCTHALAGQTVDLPEVE
jgi:hypothetical protein